METHELFSSLLGLTSGWEVDSVALSLAASEVEIRVRHVGRLVCPVCGLECSLYDHSDERRWRHLDTMQFATVVVARVPRCNCLTDGVKQIEVPWAGVKSRFTFGMEEFVIRVLELTKSQARTARILGLSPHQVHEVMHRAVMRGLSRRSVGVVAHLGIDEKSFQKRDFGTILCDLAGKRVLEVERGRKEETARQAFASLAYPEQVQTVCLDMSESYRNAVLTNLQDADLIHDRFHVAMMLSEAVDKTRRTEAKKHPELKDSRYVWLKNPENLTDKQRTTFDHLIKTELKTAEAYGLKQVFRMFFEQDTVKDAATFFTDWVQEVNRRELSHIQKVAKTLSKNLNGLLNAVKWKLTNAYAESINASIQELKTVARGFRRFENFRIAILFFLGKLDLNPRKSS